MITYLVSGDEDIRPSHENLRRSGRRVRYDDEVDLNAAQALRQRRRYVVVAHGRPDGTILWFNSAAAARVRWLWVGMPDPPTSLRLYLYSCNAGPQLSRFLHDCDCFGHSSTVPMPTDGARVVVLDFLSQVDRLVRSRNFDAATWRSALSAYVNEEWERELENRTSPLKASALQMLSESLR